jgi:ribosome-associated heat shock protein Hsp15
MRVDVWLWAVRLAKSRSVATAWCRTGRVRVNGARVKPASRVKVGDRVEFRTDRERVVEVTVLLPKRVGAPEAEKAYLDHSPPLPSKELRVPLALRDRGAGRPTKRDRREIDRLRGRG